MQTDANINTKALFIFLADWRDKFAKGSVVLRLLKFQTFCQFPLKSLGVLFGVNTLWCVYTMFRTSHALELIYIFCLVWIVQNLLNGHNKRFIVGNLRKQ